MKAPFLFIYTWILYKYHSFRLRKIDYFQYNTLTNISFPLPKFFASVTSYGNYKAISKLKRSPFNFLTEYLEHGVSFSENPISVTHFGYFNRPFIKKIYTFGNVRKVLIESYLKEKNLKRKVISIGPYIKGAKFFKAENELIKIKAEYGKILLVFPSHSTHTVDSIYSHDEFIAEIKRIATNFDAVFMCLYWKDVQIGKANLYETEGFKVVTAGYGNDPAFLSRLKDLIEISTQTMSNNIGTHIGYSVCMGKPHYLYAQESEYVNAGTSTKIDIDPSFKEIKKQFRIQFGTYSEVITPGQLELVKKYWGEWES